jgi:hypothetical protein
MSTIRRPTAMDLIIPHESFLAILGHLSERDRRRVLGTCKRMRALLQQKWMPLARAAFDAFKARCLEERWHPMNALTVRISKQFCYERGTRYRTYTVSLKDNGLICFVSDEYFQSGLGATFPCERKIRLFSPWFHTLMSRQGRVVRTGVPDGVLQMLRSASPRLM